MDLTSTQLLKHSLKKCNFPWAHLFDEDLGHIAVVVEGGQMQRREAVILLNVHQLPRPGQDLLRGPAARTTPQASISQSAQQHGSTWLRSRAVSEQACRLATVVFVAEN